MNRLAIPLQACRNALAALVVAAAVFGMLSTPALAKDSAGSLFKRGQAAEAREDYDAAYDFFQRAYAKKPQDLAYRAAFYRVRQTASSAHVTHGRKLLSQGDDTGALAEFIRGSEIDPGNEAATQEIARVRSRQTPSTPLPETSLTAASSQELEDASSPVRLKLTSNEPLTLHYSEDSKVIYQAIGKAAGINVLFDPDYNSKRIQVDLKDVTLLDALRIVGTMSSTFWKPITENTIFVAQNSRAKRTELDEQAVQTFYISNAFQTNDLNDIQTAIRNVLTNTKVFAVPTQNAIVMRATPDELLLAQKVIDDLDKARPEVVVDIAVMEVNKDKLRNIGLSWPGSISFALQPPTSSTTSTTTTDTSSTSSLTLNNLANLNANNFAVTVSAATANLLLSDSNTKILQNPRLRSTDSQKATMKIGSRIPIATGSYQTGVSTAVTSSLVNTQFQYIDVGVQIEMTPTVHYDHDVTLKMKIEVSSESGTSTISGVTEPIISQRTTEQTIRLREGEANILGGILDKEDIASSSGIPGLGELPLLKYIFGSKSHEVKDDEIVFVLIPHVVRGQSISPLNLRTIDTGSGQTVDLRHITAVRQTTPASQTPGSGRVQTGAVTTPSGLPGQSAAAAVPSALAQFRKSSQEADAAMAKTPPPTPTPIASVPVAQPPSVAATTTVPAAGPAAGASFILTPPAAIPAAGTNFPVAVNLAGGTDISSVPVQIQYDASKLMLVNVDTGDLLGKDGQAVALVHRDDGPGTITIAASRPPGTPGISGSGTICILTFQAKQAGTSDLIVTKPGLLDSAQHPVPASAQNAHITVK